MSRNRVVQPASRRQFWSTALVASGAWLLGGCSGAQLLTALTPATAVQIHTGLAYGQDPRQQLDLYQPLGRRGPLPVLVFVHGGAWEFGERAEYGFVGKSFAQAGFLTAIISYRLAPQHVYPAFVEDTADAIGWVGRHAGDYQGDAHQLVVMGHSAGAFNAVAAVDDPRHWARTGLQAGQVRAVIGLAGPYSYDHRTDPSRVAFPTDATPEQVMADRHLRADAPPHLLMTGGRDTRVAPGNLTRMVAALESQQIPVTVINMPRANHAGLVATLSPVASVVGDTRTRILDWLAGLSPAVASPVPTH